MRNYVVFILLLQNSNHAQNWEWKKTYYFWKIEQSRHWDRSPNTWDGGPTTCRCMFLPSKIVKVLVSITDKDLHVLIFKN